MKYLVKMSSIGLLLGLSNVASAHHSSAPHFDHESPISIEGSFSDIRIVNPHSYIYVDVEQDGEIAEWRCELNSATQLGRTGWTADMFSPGEKLVITGSPARREDNVCYMSTIEFSDGREITRYGNVSDMQSATDQSAQTDSIPTRPMFLADGRSNIEGAWITKSFGRNGLGIDPEYIATKAGELAVDGYEMAYDDPILRCHPVNIFNGWNHDSHVNEIRVEENQITLQYGFMDFVRTVHLDMDEHPENLTPSAGGHSIGRWEEDVLIVDTIGFEEGVLLHKSGAKHSSEMHSVERFYIDPDTGYLNRDYTITDPLYLEGEASGLDMMAVSATGYVPYNCVELSGENNLRPSASSSAPKASESELPENTEATIVKPWWQFWE